MCVGREGGDSLKDGPRSSRLIWQGSLSAMSTACYNMTSRYDGVANSVTQHRTFLRSPTPLAAMEESSNVTYRGLDSPASLYSSSCASGEVSQRTSTESSVDEDSHSRFHLSYNSESEMIVSDTTSESDYQEMTSQALPNFKAISKRQSRKRPNKAKSSPIILSSDEQDSLPGLSTSIILSSDDETPPTSPPVTSELSAVPLTVSVSLNQIKLNSKQGDMTTPTPPIDVSDSSTPTPDTPSLRTPISLKIKRSPVSNQWQSFIVMANHDTACITTGMDMLNAKETDPNELDDTVASSPCVVEIDAPDDTLSVVSGISAMDNTSISSCSSSSTVESRCGQEQVLVSTPKSCSPRDGAAIDSVFSFDDVLSVTSLSSSDSCFTLDKAYTTRIRPSSSSSRKRSRAPPANKPSINRNFSFEGLFSDSTPELTLRDGLLVPAHSLAVKGKSYAPRDHLIHTWSNGTPVTNLAQNNQPPSDKPSLK